MTASVSDTGSLPLHTSVSVAPPATTVGLHSVNVTGEDNAGNKTTVSCSYSVTSLYTFTGFFQPVDNLPTLNSVKAGQAIPVKFSLGGNRGLNVLASGSPQSQQTTCNSNEPVDAIEETTSAGSSSLSYDTGTNTYTYTWKTDKTWANTCRQLVLTLERRHIRAGELQVHEVAAPTLQRKAAAGPQRPPPPLPPPGLRRESLLLADRRGAVRDPAAQIARTRRTGAPSMRTRDVLGLL